MKQKTKCRFGWHDWGKWLMVTRTFTENIDPSTGLPFDPPISYSRIGQVRECRECGVRRLRYVR